MHMLLLAVVAAIASGEGRPDASGDGLPSASPLSVGMSAERLKAIDRVVLRGFTAGGYPGGAVVVGRKGNAVWQKGFGKLGWASSSPAVDPKRTIYDLASLTKVVGLTTAAMILYDEGRLSLDARVVEYVPAFSGGYKDSVTILQLLTHRSGLPAGRDLWKVARSPAEARWMVLESALAFKPGERYIYSDLGPDVLGIVIEEITGTTLDVFLAERVFGPLGMSDTFFRPPDSLHYRIAPTEVTPPRGYALRGEVHDENAYVLGGVAGHAGLFSTASDLSMFAQMMLNRGELNGVRIVSDSTVALFTARTAGRRALGWDTANGDAGSGEYLGSQAYGHTGYTGTSLWIDPERDMFVILLTNRVHAPRAPRPAKIISDVRADLADAAALAVIDYPDGILAMPASFRADRAVGWKPTPVKRSRGKSARRSTGKRTASAVQKRAGAKAAARPAATNSPAQRLATGAAGRAP